MKSKGFTLIELMIVVAIIAIIAAIAIPNLLRSRMAANEVAAIAACKAFCTAENIYRRTDYNKDGVLEYASRLSGVNSLYTGTVAATAGDIALIDSSFALAEGDPQVLTGPAEFNAPAQVAKAGYVFMVLNNEVNGTVSYLDSNGRLTLGFAFSAAPNQYDSTGRNCYQVNASGSIIQGDVGFAGHRNSYDPNASGLIWVVAE